MKRLVGGTVLACVVAIVLNCSAPTAQAQSNGTSLLPVPGGLEAQDKPRNFDPYSLLEGPSLDGPMLPQAPMLRLEGSNAPGSGAVMLANTPADYDWWNGCSPTAAGMLFGWWEEAGWDAFPGNHRNLPASFPGTSTNPAHYQDARGVVAGWAHKQAGMAAGLNYGHYAGHAPDSLADFMLTNNGGSFRSRMPWGFQTFGAWDDPRTPEIESRSFQATNYYTSSGWTYDDYRAEIDAGRPVHLGLSSTAGGHSVLGVGYNNTGGKENVVLLTTWGSGLREWQWSNETDSGYNFSVYGSTYLTPSTVPTPELSAYFSLGHTYVGDLTVTLGVGDPASPDWSTQVWNRGGGNAHNLVLTDIDCTPVLSDFLSGPLDWFLEVTDSDSGDTGMIYDFQVRYQFDNLVFQYQGDPVPILDQQTSFAYLTSVPEPASLVLLALGLLFFMRRRDR